MMMGRFISKVQSLLFQVSCLSNYYYYYYHHIGRRWTEQYNVLIPVHILDFLSFLQRKLGDELGRILLPLLVVLSVAISLVIFALGKWHTAHLEHQEGREQRADEGK